MKQLHYATNEAARRLINGEIDENAAVQWLQKYAVMQPLFAQLQIKFIKRYRSYVINYNLGEDMVRRYIEKRSGANRHRLRGILPQLEREPHQHGFDQLTGDHQYRLSERRIGHGGHVVQ